MKHVAGETDEAPEVTPKTDDAVMRIDLDSVLRSKMPRRYRYVPRLLVRWVERLICQDRLNELLEHNAGRTGAAFCRGVLSELRVSARFSGVERLPDPSHRRVVYVSNHPLGGLDGMILIDWLTRRHGGQVWFVVNDLLMFVEPLRSVFVPVNKVGGQSRECSDRLNEVFGGDDPILVFPAGLVSRKGKGGVIHDLRWHKMCVMRAARSGRDIIPLHFGGHNSKFFYNFARLRTRLGIGFNIEMALLPREMLRQRDVTHHVIFGDTVPAASLPTGGAQAQDMADRLCRMSYDLADGATDDGE